MKYSPLHQAYKAILDTERKLTREGIDSKWLDSLYDALACLNEEISKPMPMAPEWQTLTEQEIDTTWRSVDYTVAYSQFRIDVARAIEAKLKEKNGG